MKTNGGKFRAAALIGAAALALAFATGTRAQNQNSKTTMQHFGDNNHGLTQRRGARLCLQWLATSPASQARWRTVR